MADLDIVVGTALCRSLELVLRVELGTQVFCQDVSAESQRWDVVATDDVGSVLRRVSHTSTVPERMAMAGAELRDMRSAVEQELGDHGLAGIEISLHARRLPTTRLKRQALGRELAARILESQATGRSVIEDPVAVLLKGGQPHEDSIAQAFSRVEVWTTHTSRPARVRLSSDRRLSYRVPELHEEVLPAISQKRARHGELTAELTLVVEPLLADLNDHAVGELRQRLAPAHGGFRSVYVGRMAGEDFPLARIY